LAVALNLKPTKKTFLSIAKIISHKSGITIDRTALRREDCLFCWFCEHPKWVEYAASSDLSTISATSEPALFTPPRPSVALTVCEPSQPMEAPRAWKLRLSYFDRPQLIQD
jgi:hypothetical protein